MHINSFSLALAATLSLAPALGEATEIYGGVATTGLELGLSQTLAGPLSARVEYNALDVSHNFTTSGIHYDAKLKASNAGVYLDCFFFGGARLSGGALIGHRNIHGMAASLGNTIVLNGVTYPVSPADTLDFDARFPTVTPYLGLGFGHNDSRAGLHFYADAGVAYGRPEVHLSPSASLAAKVSASDLAGEQASVQDKANNLRVYPVLKLGLIYAF